ncbi:hypothetical protein [Synechococcus lacustris]|uniref:hypothetical protein n=1 Tax=Synechococcus lacustris TaxID=2116544 RepID=UPI0020CDF6CF|nr:hypothetical protein [Synechococcus lacustris]MCP9795472.1 hypothetical protein [Synechococcus lacustris L1F-Slac]
MKRRLSFVAAVFAATATAPALAQSMPDPGKMFMINAVTPGVVSFSGEGTAQFNNSSSTSNAFSVGSSTNFGVNASASSTKDYLVDSSALLALSGTSQLQQTIGTSSSAANTMAAAEAASKAADSIANRTTTSEFGQNWNDYKAQNGVDTSSTTQNTTALEYKTQAAYDAARKDFFNEQMTEAFSNVTTASTTSSSQGASGQGIIKGEFVTTNSNRTDIGASAGSSAANSASATSVANSEFGSSYIEYTNKFLSYAGSDKIINTESEKAAASAAGVQFNETTGTALKETSQSGTEEKSWTDARQEKVDSVMSSLQLASASQGAVTQDSQATVTVTGVGSIATLNSLDTTNFNVDVATRLRNSIPESNGTANGNAGGNLATSSFANQSNTLAANAFIQAFGPNTVKLMGDSEGNLTGAEIQGRLAVQLFTTDEKGVSSTPSATVGGAATLNETAITLPQ